MGELSISLMRAFVWELSVRIRTWPPVKERAAYPRFFNAIQSSAIVTCSPVDSSTSISLGIGCSVIS